MDAINRPSPEQAWQAALTILQREISKAAFDTWVKSTRPVSFSEDVFTIGTANDYGRDWLESHLTSTLEIFLSDIMNRRVSIRFVVQDTDNDCHGEDHECENLRKGEDERASVGEDHPEEVENEDIVLGFAYNSIRDIFLQPNRVVRLPVYFLRWLPYVNTQVIFLVMALWQEYYLATGGKTTRNSPKVSVRAEQVCQWAGLSRSQFFRLIQPGSPLGWFARKVETDYEVDRCTGRSKKSSNKYMLFDTPLTPGDAEDLKIFLISRQVNDSPIEALQTTLSIEPKSILRYPIRMPLYDFENTPPRPITVQDLVKDLVGKHLDGELSKLADQLADKLTGRGEFILVSWYFLKNWLPRLGSDASMLILILRNLCYFNDQSGEIRDEVWIEGGFEAIANRLGVNNPRLIANWFPAVIERGKHKADLTKRTGQEYQRRKELQDLLGLFVQRIDYRPNSAGSFDWKFKIQRVDPLIPEHEAIRETCCNLLSKCEDQGALDELYSWIEKSSNDCFETVNNDPMIVLRPSEMTNDCSETLKMVFKDCFETHNLSSNGCFETLLKILKNIKDSFSERDSSPIQDSPLPSKNMNSPVEAVTNENGNWCLEKLLLRADLKNRTTLINQENSAIPFVSWVIHGASQPNILNPYNLAISRLKDNSGIGAGGASQRLAALMPLQLANLIEQELSFYSPSNRDWEMLFGRVKPERVRLLADSLGITLEIKEG